MDVFEKSILRNKKVFAVLLVLGIFGLASTTFALEIGWPQSPGGVNLTDDSTLTDLIQYLYEWGIALGGFATFVALTLAGFDYLTSAGNPNQMSAAKNRIGSALTGLVLLLSSWLILNTINPELTTFSVPSFDITEMPPITSGSFGALPPCTETELYNSSGGLMVTLSATSPAISPGWYDFGVGPAYPVASKAFYNKPTDEQHCNFGFDKATDGKTCLGEMTCDYGQTRCESGPTGGGCFLQITIEGSGGLGCGDTIAYLPATESSFADWGIAADRFTTAKCVYLKFPK